MNNKFTFFWYTSSPFSQWHPSLFTVKDTAARTGRNPSTGEPLEIAASKRLGFKAARGLKDAITATV